MLERSKEEGASSGSQTKSQDRGSKEEGASSGSQTKSQDRAISVSHLIPSPATKERITAFWNLDPATRSFQAITKDSQEVSSGSVTMSSAGKSSKSATRFSVTDLSTVAPRSGSRKTAASPSSVVPKPMTSKGGKKRKATEAENLEGLPLIRHQFEEYFSEVRIQDPD
ncbi:hypothetical protein HanIR_Chr10g0474301 [Helianthus annuus]|nr:hypothetical protein HanIR_Chr10g0474301 [Helianthus annuus]